MMNTCASFLVAPHNLTYDKRTIAVYDKNKDKVIGECSKIIKKYDDEWLKKMKGMGYTSFGDNSDTDNDLEAKELMMQKNKLKPRQIVHTEALVSKLRRNSQGQQVHGRQMIKPDQKLYQKMIKK